MTTISVTIEDDRKAKKFLQLLADLNYVSGYRLTQKAVVSNKKHQELKEALLTHTQTMLSEKLG